MTLLTLVAGQKPKDPLVLPITKSDGAPVDLTLYDSVSVRFRSPDGDYVSDAGSSTTVQNTNEAVYNWGDNSIFPTPGEYSVSVEMLKNGGFSDYSSIGAISVQRGIDYFPATDPLVTSEEVYSRVGLTVDIQDIFRAQAVIEDELGEDLTVAPFEEGSTFFDDISSDDLRLLKNAIMRQVEYLQEHPETLSALSGVQSATANGVSVTYAPGASESFLAPLAKKAIAQLSWRRNGFRTLVPAPPYTTAPHEVTWQHLWSEQI